MYRKIGGSHDGCAVRLADPTEIAHGLCDHYLRQHALPDGAEGGECSLMVSCGEVLQGCAVLLAFGVTWNPSRQENGIGLGIGVEELHNPLCVSEGDGVWWKSPCVAVTPGC